MDAIAIVLIAVGLAGALCCLWARMDYLERKRHTDAHVNAWTAQPPIPLPSIPVLPIPEYPDYQLEPEAAHLPTWTPTVSHYPDQGTEPEAFDPDGYPDVRDMAETASQDDFDAIGDHEGDD